jgi:L-aspartate oxidase
MRVINAIHEPVWTDFLVVGAGVAGLRAAIELSRWGRVLVVAKDSLRESSSEYAQGGIAVALSDDDEVSLHEADTIAAGDGLCDQQAVKVLVNEGPDRIQELIEWGALFDREGSRLLFAREGAHSRNRVLHAQGDSTGREIARTLYFKAASHENISFRSFSSVTDLLLDGERVVGAVALSDANGVLIPILARGVLLATGGMGRIYRDTTNPDVATGDGVAAAWRAGALVSDLEFIQFHPTALCVPGAPRFLLSEAIRGEGARLINNKGERFMERYHRLRELAPRDVVSRAIASEMRETASSHVLLDLSHRGAGFAEKRFPRIYGTCLEYGIDLDRMPAPVVPAAHYAMGGVWTDLEGRTSIPGLWAAGEVACVGVHGANRLASNSLLEGIVFGARAGRSLANATHSAPVSYTPPAPACIPDMRVDELREMAWDCAGIVRGREGLESLIRRCEEAPLNPVNSFTRAGAELRNIQTLACLIARSAIAREESRGAHYRIDYPGSSPRFAAHSRLRNDWSEVQFA